jgi:hypothetical protein
MMGFVVPLTVITLVVALLGRRTQQPHHKG